MVTTSVFGTVSEVRYRVSGLPWALFGKPSPAGSLPLMADAAKTGNLKLERKRLWRMVFIVRCALQRLGIIGGYHATDSTHHHHHTSNHRKVARK